jgi:hypothetical protein
MSHPSEVRIVVGSDRDADLTALTRWTTQLSAELMAAGLRPSRPHDPELPEATKSAGITLTQLVVALASSSVLVAVVRTVQSFATRARGSKIRVELDGDAIELDNADDDQRQQIVDLWLARHVAEAVPPVREEQF